MAGQIEKPQNSGDFASSNSKSSAPAASLETSQMPPQIQTQVLQPAPPQQQPQASADTSAPAPASAPAAGPSSAKGPLATADHSSQGILCTEILHVQNKRYYFDIKEHDYGRFLKLAELGTTGKKSRMVIPVYLIPEFCQIFGECLVEFEKLPPMGRNDRGGSGDHTSSNQKTAATEYYSKFLERGKRRYYFNLKENSRGRYLRVKAIGDIPATFPGVRRRLSSNDAARAIVLPANGILNFMQLLQELGRKWGIDEAVDKVALTDKHYAEHGKEHDRFMHSVRITCRDFKKIVFLDAGQNSRGTFARLTEQQRSRRESTTVPSSYFKTIGEWFLEAAEKLPEEEKLSNQMAELTMKQKEEERKKLAEAQAMPGRVGSFRREVASDCE